ncbi:tyrosine-type recombinase/integrase [Roseateles sp. LKC17W]|uniref:Tyrosine-type recombinase/integrase n=1 Tax=Pelomonas margarita TaxID=3299031 RepID=A0ABW7FGY8_9BURK
MAHESDAEAVDGFLQYLQAARGRSARTVEAYRACLARLQEFLDGRALLDAEPVELEAWSGIWLHKRGVIARSRRQYISAARGFYSWARRRGLVKRNAAGELQHPKTAKPLPEVTSLASAEKLMWAPDLSTFLGLRDAAMLSLLIGCGLRVGGLVALNVEDLRPGEVDGKPRLIVRVTEKGEKTRVLPVPREAEMLLRVYLDHEELRTYDRQVKAGADVRTVLFVNARNTRCKPEDWHGEAVRISRKSVWRMIQRHGEAVGVPKAELHPHALRHLFGTELAEDGVDLILRQELLGHVDPKTTAIYDSLSSRRKTATVDKSGPLAKIKTPVSELLRRL